MRPYDSRIHFYSGIISSDAVANILVADVVLAENHIDLTLNFYKVSLSSASMAEDAFSGIIESVIIGSLASLSGDGNAGCGTDRDTNWRRKCQVFQLDDKCDLILRLECVVTRF